MANKYTRIEIKCAHCGNAFSIVPCRAGIAKYCSISCKFAALTRKVKNSVTNKEYRYLHNKFKEIIRINAFKCRREWESLDEKIQDGRLILWRCAQNIKKQQIDVENISSAYVGISLEKGLIARKKELNYTNKTACYGEWEESLVNTFFKTSSNLDAKIDIENLLAKCIKTAATDGDMKLALIKGACNNVINIKDVAGRFNLTKGAFHHRANNGIKKLFFSHKKELLEYLSSDLLPFNTNHDIRPEKRICSYCGQEFMTPHQDPSNRFRFCSKRCRDNLNAKAAYARNKLRKKLLAS